MGVWQWLGDMERVRKILSSHPWVSIWMPLKLFNAVLRSFGHICFASSPLTGLLVLAAIFYSDVALGFAAVMAAVIATVATKLLGGNPDLTDDGLPAFNAVLVALISVAVLPSILGSPLTALHWALLAVTCFFTAYVDIGMSAIMAPSGLPVLSIPFNIVLSVCYLAARGYYAGHNLNTSFRDLQGASLNVTLNSSNSSDDLSNSFDWFKIAQGSFLAAGQVYGCGNLISSLLIWIGFLVFSPVLSFFFFIGSVIGTVCGFFIAPPELLFEVYAGLWGFNSLLSSGCISFFLVPTLHMCCASLVSAFMAVFLQAALLNIFVPTQMPVVSFPFNVSCCLILAIALQKGTSLEMVQKKRFHEQHIYQLRSVTATRSIEDLTNFGKRYSAILTTEA